MKGEKEEVQTLGSELLQYLKEREMGDPKSLRRAGQGRRRELEMFGVLEAEMTVCQAGDAYQWCGTNAAEGKERRGLRNGFGLAVR